jgi:lipoprotein NlpD
MGKTVRRLASVATMALAACSPVGLMLAAPGLLQARPAKTAQDAPDNAIVAWTYTVQSGDTFVSIARRMGVPMAALAAENRCRCPI